jgi:hypothetical protein
MDTLEIFRDSFTSSGSITISCSCGRLHVADDDINQLEEEEQKSIEEFEKDHPDKVIHHSDCSISWFHFSNKQVVVECPCKADVKIHNMLMNNRYHQIIKFFKSLLKAEQSELKMKEELTEGI